MKTSVVIIISFTVLCLAQLAAADDIAGSIKSVKGKCAVIRNGARINGEAGLRLYKNDTLTTSDDGSMGVVFRDNSTLALGPGSTVVIDEFLFSPGEGQLGMVTKMLKGSAVFLSGEIAKLSPESMKVETPLATIGIRGTRFLVNVE